MIAQYTLFHRFAIMRRSAGTNRVRSAISADVLYDVAVISDVIAAHQPKPSSESYGNPMRISIVAEISHSPSRACDSRTNPLRDLFRGNSAPS